MGTFQKAKNNNYDYNNYPLVKAKDCLLSGDKDPSRRSMMRY